MNNKLPTLLNLKPTVAILDDDPELIADMENCMNNHEIELLGYSNSKQFIKTISEKYQIFEELLFELFNEINTKNSKFNLSKIFNNICENRCFSVALIDLNLKKNHEYEGYEICEAISPFLTKSIIYSGSDFNEISLDMLNSGIISGQINKSKDLFEDLLPTIFKLNREFLEHHFNLMHLSCLTNVPISNLRQKILDSKMPSQDHEYIILDSNINYLTKDKL